VELLIIFSSKIDAMKLEVVCVVSALPVDIISIFIYCEDYGNNIYFMKS